MNNMIIDLPPTRKNYRFPGIIGAKGRRFVIDWPKAKEKANSRFFYFILTIFASLYITACSSVPSKTIPMPPISTSLPGPRMDAFHTVGPGETLWRIGKMYDVSVDELIQTNHLSNPQDLKMGQELKVPNAAQIKPVVTLYPSDKWEYIIIHHSGTEEGSALQFHHWHLNKGWDKGVGYHFVIDTNQSSKQDGQIESTPRWIKQEDGAHCKADEMNPRAIGICLVGNFDEEKVSQKQMAALVFLVNKLRRHYKIPMDHVLGHGKVPGASTHCPGIHFPWGEFTNRLRNAHSE
jgi:LysM repeat protein